MSTNYYLAHREAHAAYVSTGIEGRTFLDLARLHVAKRIQGGDDAHWTFQAIAPDRATAKRILGDDAVVVAEIAAHRHGLLPETSAHIHSVDGWRTALRSLPASTVLVDEYMEQVDPDELIGEWASLAPSIPLTTSYPVGDKASRVYASIAARLSSEDFTDSEGQRFTYRRFS